jgi:hypothetical protein
MIHETGTKTELGGRGIIGVQQLLSFQLRCGDAFHLPEKNVVAEKENAFRRDWKSVPY